MDEKLPAPLTPIECDLRDFGFMPLDVVRLRDSEVASTPDAEAFRCSVLAWCASWHQIPAGSLPNNEVALARILGFGRDIESFRRVRDADGMHGWVLCSDGRLYHPVVCEKALDAWERKKAMRSRTEAARRAREEKRRTERDSASTESAAKTVTETTEQGQGQGQIRTPLPPKGGGGASPKGDDVPGFARFWAAWPANDRKGNKAACLRRWRRTGCEAMTATILASLERWKASRDWRKDAGRFIPAPLVWLNQSRWENDVRSSDGADEFQIIDPTPEEARAMLGAE